MILILHEVAAEFDDHSGRQRLLPVLQLDNAYSLESGTHIRTASGDEFSVEESFNDIVSQIGEVLCGLDKDDGDALIAA